MSSPPIVVIADLETTGIKVNEAGACQVAALILVPTGNNFRIEPLFQTYCQPSARMTAEAEKIHGITPDKYRIMPTDRMALWVLQRAIVSLGANVVLAGYNSDRYDYPIIRRLCPRFPTFPQLDVMNLALRRDAGQSYKLVDVFQQECADDPEAAWLLENAHDAMADCRMTALVLAKMMRQRETQGASDLVEEMRTPKRLNLMPHGQHRGVPFNQVPVSYLQWAAGKWTDMAPDLEFTFKSLGLR